MIRIVSWSLAPAGETTASAAAVGAVLSWLGADVLCLQGLPDGVLADAIASRLGPDWKPHTLPGPAGQYLAVLAGPRLEIVAYHLAPTAAGDGAAVTLRRPGRPTFVVLCLDAAAEASDSGTRSRYVRGMLEWCDAHPAPLVVLGGKIEVDTATRRLLADRFTDTCVAGTYASEIRCASATAVSARAGSVDNVDLSSVPSAPVLTDVAAP
jgi:hypothetical protein